MIGNRWINNKNAQESTKKCLALTIINILS